MKTTKFYVYHPISGAIDFADGTTTAEDIVTAVEEGRPFFDSESDAESYITTNYEKAPDNDNDKSDSILYQDEFEVRSVEVEHTEYTK